MENQTAKNKFNIFDDYCIEYVSNLTPMDCQINDVIVNYDVEKSLNIKIHKTLIYKDHFIFHDIDKSYIINSMDDDKTSWKCIHGLLYVSPLTKEYIVLNTDSKEIYTSPLSEKEFNFTRMELPCEFHDKDMYVINIFNALFIFSIDSEAMYVYCMDGQNKLYKIPLSPTENPNNISINAIYKDESTCAELLFVLSDEQTIIRGIYIYGMGLNIVEKGKFFTTDIGDEKIKEIIFATTEGIYMIITDKKSYTTLNSNEDDIEVCEYSKAYLDIQYSTIQEVISKAIQNFKTRDDKLDEIMEDTNISSDEGDGNG